jgi:hypothetical protein
MKVKTDMKAGGLLCLDLDIDIDVSLGGCCKKPRSCGGC